jgi:hypothetical protein
MLRLMLRLIITSDIELIFITQHSSLFPDQAQD